MRRQVRSIMCGCGNCAIRINPKDICSMWNSKEAIQLWHSDPMDNGASNSDDSLINEVAEIIDEITHEPQEIII